MAQYDFGPGLGTGIARGIEGFLQAKEHAEDRRRQQENDAWVREQRDYQRGLMPIQREQAQVGLDTSRLGLESSQLALQEKQAKAEADTVVEAFKFLKANQPQLALQRYKQFDPGYAGQMPTQDPRKPGNWMIDLDGDGVLDSVNPDDIINHYEPKKFQAPQQHSQLGLGQFGSDGQWHGIEPKGTGYPTGDRGQKIRELVNRGHSQDDAADLVDGRVKMTNPDQFGDVYLVNVTDGSRRRVGGVQGKYGPGAGHPGDGSGMIGLTLPQDGMQPPPRQGLDIGSAVLQGTGPVAAVRQGINNVVGPFMPGRQPFPETNDARATVRFFQQEAKQGLVNNSKFPVHEQQLMEKMLPDPDRFLRDPDGELGKVQQLHRFLSEKQVQNTRTLQTGRVTMDARAALMDQNEAINRILGMIGSLDGQQQSGTQGTPHVGEIQDGYEFLGGNPADPRSWRQR